MIFGGEQSICFPHTAVFAIACPENETSKYEVHIDVVYSPFNNGSATTDSDTYAFNHCPYPEQVYTGWSSVHWNATGMPLECHWLVQCTLGYHWVTQRILAGCTGTQLEKLSWYSPTLECHWRNLVESGPHWDATGETLTFAAYIGTPLEWLWQPTHLVKHAK